MIVVDRRKRKQERETNVGAVIVLTILATLVCGDSMYAYRNKYEYGPLDGWWDNIDDGNQANAYMVLYWYHRGVLGGDALRIVRQPEVRD